MSPTKREAGLALKVWTEIEEMISGAVTAGVFRRAARLNPGTAHVWNEIADPYSARVGALAMQALDRHSKACDRP